MQQSFEDPAVRHAIASLSTEDTERYRLIGERLYGNNFSDIERSITGDDVVQYALTGLRSGLSIQSLTELESAALRDHWGDAWEARVCTELLHIEVEANVPALVEFNLCDPSALSALSDPSAPSDSVTTDVELCSGPCEPGLIVSDEKKCC